MHQWPTVSFKIDSKLIKHSFQCALCYIGVGACSNGRVRLVDMDSDSSGRLELCYDGNWTPFCYHWLSTSEVNAACRQLGYAGGCTSTKQNTQLYLPFTNVLCSSSTLLCQVSNTGSTCLNPFTCSQAGVKCLGEVYCRLI